jgi:catechol 2,3-dioxygenase-like lactoylglutathione lyase family enzyme
LRLYAVRLFVDDLAAARAFYVDVLGLPIVWEAGEIGALGLDAGGPQLIVETEDPEGPNAGLIGRFAGVSLQVDDIDETYRALSDRGVAFDGPPERQVWGGTLAHFRDPAGNVLTLLG